jgi:hypothetical protein
VISPALAVSLPLFGRAWAQLSTGWEEVAQVEGQPSLPYNQPSMGVAPERGFVWMARHAGRGKWNQRFWDGSFHVAARGGQKLSHYW